MTIISLDDLFFYQNAKTGQASSTAVSVRQLCKILSTGTTHVIPDTLVFHNNEWIPLKNIPILKEASSEWYYTTADDAERKGPTGVKQLQQQRGILQMVYSTSFADRGWFKVQDSPDLMQALKAFEIDPLTSEDTVATPDASPQLLSIKDDGYVDDDDQAAASVQDEIQKELEAFLTSTGVSSKEDPVEEEESYQSDGGTNYVKDHRSGKWIHEALAPKPAPTEKQDISAITSTTGTSAAAPDEKNPNKKKRKRAKFTNRNAKCWIYISGLPLDTTEEEVAHVFGKVGILDLDAETQKPKVKLYSRKETVDGMEKHFLKGDGSVCFARPESVDLAIQLFDEAPFRLEEPRTTVIRVERAKFEQRGESYQARHQSWQKRQVAKKAALQAVGWDEGQNGRITGGMKGLTIVVFKHIFTPTQAADDAFLLEMEKNLRTACSELGTVEKITVFTSNPLGVVVVRFKEPTAATAAIQQFNGKVVRDAKLECHFWDGVTDYTVKDYDKEKEEDEERHDEFGEWLETQEELPEEFKLQVES